MADRYNRGEVVYLYYSNYVWGTDTLVDCDSGFPEVSIWKPDGTIEINGAQMSWVSTGVYRYPYQLAADAPYDWWPVKYQAVTDSLITIVDDGFEVI